MLLGALSLIAESHHGIYYEDIPRNLSAHRLVRLHIVALALYRYVLRSKKQSCIPAMQRCEINNIETGSPNDGDRIESGTPTFTIHSCSYAMAQ